MHAYALRLLALASIVFGCQVAASSGPIPEDLLSDWVRWIPANVAQTDLTVRARLLSEAEESRDQLYLHYSRRYLLIEAIKGEVEGEFTVRGHSEHGSHPPAGTGEVELLSLCRWGDSYVVPDNGFSFPDHPALLRAARGAAHTRAADQKDYCRQPAP